MMIKTAPETNLFCRVDSQAVLGLKSTSVKKGCRKCINILKSAPILKDDKNCTRYGFICRVDSQAVLGLKSTSAKKGCRKYINILKSAPILKDDKNCTRYGFICTGCGT